MKFDPLTQMGVASRNVVSAQKSLKPMFLTLEELKELTGYTYSARQQRWLQQRGIHYEIAATGKPVVLRSEVERRLSGA